MRHQRGELIDHYEIVDELGEGAYAETYKARDSSSGDIVVLKFPDPHTFADAQIYQRFQRETKIAGGLDFPGELVDHFFIFAGTGAGDGHGVGPPYFDDAALWAGDFDDGVFLMEFSGGEFVGFHDGDDLFDAGDGLDVLGVDFDFLAHDANDGAELAAGEVGLEAEGFDLGGDVFDESFGGVGLEDDDHGKFL